MTPYKAAYQCDKFLNLPGFHEGAYIRCYVEDITDREFDAQYDIAPRVIFEIADCDKRVSFDFEFSSELRRKNNIYKINNLIDALTGLKKALVQQNKIAANKIKEYENKKKK